MTWIWKDELGDFFFFFLLYIFFLKKGLPFIIYTFQKLKNNDFKIIDDLTSDTNNNINYYFIRNIGKKYYTKKC